jgi:hypothetical protein
MNVPFARSPDATRDALYRVLYLASAMFSNLLILFGEPCRNRTYNLLIKSQLLCQLS